LQTKSNFNRQILILFLQCLLSFFVLGQAEKSKVPVKWETYQVSTKNIFFLLPKMPVLNKLNYYCSELKTNQYAAYAEDIVYGLNITSRERSDDLSFCKSIKKFSEKSFSEKVSEVKTLLKEKTEIKYNQGNLEIIKIKGELFTYWFINDFANKRWFEFWATESDEKKETVKKFIESVKFGKKSDGIEIGKGADRTLGDESESDSNTANVNSEQSGNSEKDEIVPLRVIIKPRASYTDAARQANVTGTVNLRVVFSSSGGIYRIDPINTLPYGLTEEAIKAAYKIVFIPAKRNGRNYSIAKNVQYTFNIY